MQNVSALIFVYFSSNSLLNQHLCLTTLNIAIKMILNWWTASHSSRSRQSSQDRLPRWLQMRKTSSMRLSPFSEPLFFSSIMRLRVQQTRIWFILLASSLSASMLSQRILNRIKPQRKFSNFRWRQWIQDLAQAFSWKIWSNITPKKTTNGKSICFNASRNAPRDWWTSSTTQSGEPLTSSFGWPSQRRSF